jgi:catechol 2,3-dioxygenase-like lactoylglutathione lyase family enzyme
MGVQLDHTIVWCVDKVQSAAFVADILGRPEPTQYGPFRVIGLDNGVSLDFCETKDKIASQHYAFLIDDESFDVVLARIRARGLTYWADPGKSQANEMNHNDGGRGFYFADPDGHLLEVMTRLYWTN